MPHVSQIPHASHIHVSHGHMDASCVAYKHMPMHLELAIKLILRGQAILRCPPATCAALLSLGWAEAHRKREVIWIECHER